MYYEYKGEITRVTDGDTVVAMCDLGFDTYRLIRFRLARINAPEIKGEERSFGVLSKAMLKDIISKCESTFHIESKKRDIYGRYIAEIEGTLKEDGSKVNLSGYMLCYGYALEYLEK